MQAILTEIITLLFGGITGVATALGQGVSSLVSNIFVDSSGTTQTLTVFGGIIAVFAGISLAIGLSRWVMNFLTSLGAKK